MCFAEERTVGFTFSAFCRCGGVAVLLGFVSGALEFAFQGDRRETGSGPPLREGFCGCENRKQRSSRAGFCFL